MLILYAPLNLIALKRASSLTIVKICIGISIVLFATEQPVINNIMSTYQMTVPIFTLITAIQKLLIVSSIFNLYVLGIRLVKVQIRTAYIQLFMLFLNIGYAIGSALGQYIVAFNLTQQIDMRS